MSLAEVERFSKDSQANAALLSDTRKKSLKAAVKHAALHGYSFTFDEAEAFVRGKAATSGKELSDDQLERVVGGLGGRRDDDD